MILESEGLLPKFIYRFARINWSEFLSFALGLIFLCTPLLSFSAHATTPVRDPRKLWAPEKQKALHLTTASVLLADYALIRRDFPEIAAFTTGEIDAWLIRNAAFVSPEQVAQNVVNSKIQTDGERDAYRPREYRRAHVFVADTGGLIDAKGTGSVDPHQGFERNGLATLADMLREYLYEKLTKRIFVHAGKFDTVGSYAVLDSGFDVIQDDGSHVRAGIILRQAHVRYHRGRIGEREREDPVVLPKKHQLDVELTLRRFGLSACIDLYPGMYSVQQMGDQLNIQGAADLSVIDFGSFRVKAFFARPIYTTYSKKGDANVSDKDILLPMNSPKFIQPDPRIRIPFELWGNTITGGGLDNVYFRSEEVAEAIRLGKGDRSTAERHFEAMLSPIEAILKSSPRERESSVDPKINDRSMICRDAFAS